MSNALRVPADDILLQGLREILRPARPRVVDRRTAVYASTHPSEVVTCEMDNGTTCRLLLKYSGFEPESFGHKLGVAYEGLVYETIVSRLAPSSIKWFGNYHEAVSGRSWLALEFAENAQRISTSVTPLSEAAMWIGNFHRTVEAAGPGMDLIMYDADYYAAWARRTLALGSRYVSTPAWLADVCRAYEEAAAELAAWRKIVIHGEYYGENILVTDKVVCPVDWESAALGPGEIDLASLTEYWNPHTVAECEAAYAETRWPDGAPAGFTKMLGLARMYIHLRWLAVAKDWESSDTNGRLERLKAQADSLGILQSLG